MCSLVCARLHMLFLSLYRCDSVPLSVFLSPTHSPIVVAHSRAHSLACPRADSCRSSTSSGSLGRASPSRALPVCCCSARARDGAPPRHPDAPRCVAEMDISRLDTADEQGLFLAEMGLKESAVRLDLVSAPR